MKISSAKAKGRNLQNHVVARILHWFPSLEGHVKSTSMGVTGEDVQLSPTARSALPISLECKSRAAIAIYKDYEQATRHAQGNFEPVLVVKQNRSKPLAILDLDYYLSLMNLRHKENSICERPKR